MNESWLDIIDEALCDLPETAFTDEVAQAQSLIHDVLNGRASPRDLLAGPTVAGGMPQQAAWVKPGGKSPDTAKPSDVIPTFEETFKEVV